MRRSVKFSIAGNLGKVLVMLLAPFIEISVALLPLQLLWLNLLTDGLLGLGLGMKPADKHIMLDSPRKKIDSFLNSGLRCHIVFVGLLIGSISSAIGAVYFRIDIPEDATWQQ